MLRHGRRAMAVGRRIGFPRATGRIFRTRNTTRSSSQNLGLLLLRKCIKTEELWFDTNSIHDMAKKERRFLVRAAVRLSAKQRSVATNPNWHDQPICQIQPDGMSERVATDGSESVSASKTPFLRVAPLNQCRRMLPDAGKFKRRPKTLTALLQAPRRLLLLHDRRRRRSR